MLNGLSKNAKDVLVSIDTGTHNTDWSGIWASSQSGNIEYQKVGDCVRIFIPTINATATTVSNISMVTALPSDLWPTNSEEVVLYVEDNLIKKVGKATIGIAGSINVYADAATGSFAGSGLSGIQKCTLQYNLK